jgi:hypothetical protein
MAISDSTALKYDLEQDDLADHEPLDKYVSMELPDEAVAILNGVMRTTGDTVESLFRRALDLYRIAVEAKLDGLKLAIVDPEDDQFVEDIAGL